jgi:hypothetical protein
VCNFAGGASGDLVAVAEELQNIPMSPPAMETVELDCIDWPTDQTRPSSCAAGPGDKMEGGRRVGSQKAVADAGGWVGVGLGKAEYMPWPYCDRVLAERSTTVFSIVTA